MANGRVGIIHCAEPMHERGRTERRFAGISEIQIAGNILGELLGIADRQFAEKIVRMLTIVQRLAMPRLACLKEKWITATHFGEKIETHHRTQPELRAVAEWMRI